MSPRRPLSDPTGPDAMPPLPDMKLTSYSVLSWSSDPVPDRTPPEAVVVMIDVDDVSILGLRLGSRAAVNQLIDALELHAVDVWGVRA